MLQSFRPNARPQGSGEPTLVLWLVAVIALLLRLYLASLWFRFGTAKIDAAWLTTNPVHGLLTVVAAGQTPMPIPSLAVVAGWLLALRADVVLSVALPLIEVTLAAAFLTGLFVRAAALVGIAVNTMLLLGGLATIGFDGKVIALEAAVLLAGGQAGLIGVGGVIRLIGSLRRHVRTRGEDSTGPEPRRRAA